MAQKFVIGFPECGALILLVVLVQSVCCGEGGGARYSKRLSVSVSDAGPSVGMGGDSVNWNK